MVALPLIVHAAHHDLAGDESAGRLADADQWVRPPPEDRINRGNRVDTVADEQVALRADRAVFGRPAFQDALDPERPLVARLVDPERSPHRDVFAIAVDGFKRLVQTQIDAGLGKDAPGP